MQGVKAHALRGLREHELAGLRPRRRFGSGENARARKEKAECERDDSL